VPPSSFFPHKVNGKGQATNQHINPKPHQINRHPRNQYQNCTVKKIPAVIDGVNKNSNVGGYAQELNEVCQAETGRAVHFVFCTFLNPKYLGK
jgi:hypothetical protein